MVLQRAGLDLLSPRPNTRILLQRTGLDPPLSLATIFQIVLQSADLDALVRIPNTVSKTQRKIFSWHMSVACKDGCVLLLCSATPNISHFPCTGALHTSGHACGSTPLLQFLPLKILLRCAIHEVCYVFDDIMLHTLTRLRFPSTISICSRTTFPLLLPPAPPLKSPC